MPENAPKSGQDPASDEAFLFTWLLDRDPRCPLCQYNLRGLTSPRCPECGQAVQLGVSLVEPYLKAWIAMVVGLIPPAAFGLFFLIAFLRSGSMRDLRFIPFWGAVALIYIVVCIPLSIAALAMRRQFQRLKRPTQHTIASIVWIALLITIVSFFSQIR
jgi:hypothetical protein